MTVEQRNSTSNQYLFVRGKVALARLEDISPEGACFADAPSVIVGEGVGYSVEGEDSIEARVAWKDGNRIGVRNVRTNLKALSSLLYQRIRSRMPTFKDVELILGGKRIRSSLRDISSNGACVLSLGVLQKGETVALRIDGSICINAQVRWVKQGRAGLRFDEEMSVERLACNTAQLMPAKSERLSRYTAA